MAGILSVNEFIVQRNVCNEMEYVRDSLLTLNPTQPGHLRPTILRNLSSGLLLSSSLPPRIRALSSLAQLARTIWTVRSASACIPTPPAPPAYPSHRPAPSMCPSSPRASHLVSIMNSFSTTARDRVQPHSHLCDPVRQAQHINRSDAGRGVSEHGEQGQQRAEGRCDREGEPRAAAALPTDACTQPCNVHSVPARARVRCRCRRRRACCPESSVSTLDCPHVHVCPVSDTCRLSDALCVMPPPCKSSSPWVLDSGMC